MRISSATVQPQHIYGLATLPRWDGQLVGPRGDIPAKALAMNLPSLSGEQRLPLGWPAGPVSRAPAGKPKPASTPLWPAWGCPGRTWSWWAPPTQPHEGVTAPPGLVRGDGRAGRRRPGRRPRAHPLHPALRGISEIGRDDNIGLCIMQGRGQAIGATASARPAPHRRTGDPPAARSRPPEWAGATTRAGGWPWTPATSTTTSSKPDPPLTAADGEATNERLRRVGTDGVGIEAVERLGPAAAPP
jgi:hypothetical protein